METFDFTDFQPEPLSDEEIDRAIGQLLVDAMVVRIEGWFEPSEVTAMLDRIDEAKN